MSDTSTHRLQVTGITCQHCVQTITRAIHRSDAEARITIELPAGIVEVGDTALPLEALRHTIEEEGYTVVA